jgi:hypothetical protein
MPCLVTITTQPACTGSRQPTLPPPLSCFHVCSWQGKPTRVQKTKMAHLDAAARVRGVQPRTRKSKGQRRAQQDAGQDDQEQARADRRRVPQHPVRHVHPSQPAHCTTGVKVLNTCLLLLKCSVPFRSTTECKAGL